jgi:hypothetical protein
LASCNVPVALSAASQLDFWERLPDYLQHDSLVRKMDSNNFIPWHTMLWCIVHNKSIPCEEQYMPVVNALVSFLKKDYQQTQMVFDQLRVPSNSTLLY